MKLSVIYLTRHCPRHCAYCAIRDTLEPQKELQMSEWRHAFQILKAVGVDFNLILGNEPWLLGENLLPILYSTDVPYALYTSGVPSLFKKYHLSFFGYNQIKNFSIGVDYPLGVNVISKDDSYTKAMDAWEALRYVRKFYPWVETHATITVHKLNYQYLPLLVRQLRDLHINTNINFIHWNNGGGFDFFPTFKELNKLMFSENDYFSLRNVLTEVLKTPELIQNPQMLTLPFPELLGMHWHCQGNPYGGPTVDADGSLRVCGYRKGIETSKFSIFDLPSKTKEWEAAVKEDASHCPGCSWSCSWMYHYWEKNNPEQGKQVFINHNTKN